LFADLGAALASLGMPALAIVLFTIVVRLALHPFYRAAVRGEKAKAKLAPEIQKLQKKYGKDMMRLSEESQKVYKRNGVSMFAGMLPMLATVPFFMVIYQVVTTPNPLLEGTLFGISLGSHFTTGFAWVSPVSGSPASTRSPTTMSSITLEVPSASRTSVPATKHALRETPVSTLADVTPPVTPPVSAPPPVARARPPTVSGCPETA
jgi:YidC/Oxa1 family membrane protein insertase